MVGAASLGARTSALSASNTATRTAPPNTPHSGDIWAPELHALHGRWWVYFAADNPAIGNASHRVFVLGGPPAHTDPCASGAPWEFLGPLRGLPNGPAEKGQWAIGESTTRTITPKDHGEAFKMVPKRPKHFY